MYRSLAHVLHFFVPPVHQDLVGPPGGQSAGEFGGKVERLPQVENGVRSQTFQVSETWKVSETSGTRDFADARSSSRTGM